MRIAYLHQYFNTPTMTGGTRSYEMARRLVDYGHDVEMITTWRSGCQYDEWFTTQEAGINVHWLPVAYSNNMGFVDRVKAFLHFAISARARAVSTRADLVFATSTPLTIAIPGVGAAKALKVPLVFEVRDLWPEMPISTGDLKNPALIALANKLERYAYTNSQEIIALSPGMADGVERAGIPTDRITMIPNSSDLDVFENSKGLLEDVLPNAPNLTGKKLVIYCGTFGRVNKVSYMAKVAAAAREIDPRIVFFAVGEGAEEGILRETAQNLGVLGNNMFIFPPVAKSQVPAVFRACQMSMSLFDDIPAMRNNSANKFFDTLASGRPIGINYLGWHADLVHTEEMGLVLPFDDPRTAAQQISKFLNDQSATEQAGKNALRVAQEQFDRDILAQKFQKVLLRAQTNYRS